MPNFALPGFIKKKTASQLYRRSPRQITRDVTIALEMRDESVLSNLLIRTEEGTTIEGPDLTTDAIKNLRADGKNPMWFLRKSWMEKTYGLRKDPSTQIADEDDDFGPVSDEDASVQPDAKPDSIVTLMQESIRELKRDKEMLTEQLKIKDQQIRETTERWKESNYISHGLNQRLEAMEKRFELNSRSLQRAALKSPNVISHQPVTETNQEPIAGHPVRPESNLVNPKSAKSKRGVGRKQSPLSPPTKKRLAPKWYEMPTLKRLFHRDK